MPMTLFLAVMVRTSSVRTEVPAVVPLLVYAVLLGWLAWHGIRSVQIDLAHRAFENSYDRLYDAAQAYRNAPGLVQLGRARAAAAYSCFRWQRVMLLDGESEPDRSWQCMLAWVRRWERRYS